MTRTYEINDVAVGARRKFWARTTDDTCISGEVTPPPRAGDPVTVICHGFTGTHTNKAMSGIHDALADSFGVATFDFRGHGSSDGMCTLGDAEALDVEAVVQTMRDMAPGSPIVGIGFSMGAAALMRAAALYRDIDAVISVSCPSRWRVPRRPAPIAAMFLTRTSAGRKLLNKYGIRVFPTWTKPASPAQIASAVSPTPLAVVYGSADKYFPLSDSIELYEAARAPRNLLSIADGGHGEQLADAQYAAVWKTLVNELLDSGVCSDSAELLRNDAFVVRPTGAYRD